MCLTLAVVSGGLAYLFLTVDLIPNPGSAERILIDDFMRILLAIAGVVFGIVVTILSYSLLFFRRRPGDESDARPTSGNSFLELTWTIIPLVVVVILSFQGDEILDQMMAKRPGRGMTSTVYSLGVFVPGMLSPADTSARELPIDVTASRFIWRFAYPEQGIDSAYTLVVPVDHRVVFRIQSQDVIHSFWVQQWGPKQDAVPGLSPVLRITPTKTGQYAVECSQLCGFGHTNMTAPVRVVSNEEFEEWVEEQRSAAGTPSPPAGSHVMIDLAASNMAFDTRVITVPAGVMVMISFDNRDKGVPHNFAVYESPAAQKQIFVGRIITGPQRISYSFMAPTRPGTYFFRCDVHPTTMTGTFVVK